MYTVVPQDGRHAFQPQRIPEFARPAKQPPRAEQAAAEAEERPRKMSLLAALRGAGTAQIQARQVFTYEVLKVRSAVGQVYRLAFLSPAVVFLARPSLYFFLGLYTLLGAADCLCALELLGLQARVDRLRGLRTLRGEALAIVRAVLALAAVVLGLAALHLLNRDRFVLADLHAYLAMAQGCLAGVVALACVATSSADADRALLSGETLYRNVRSGGALVGMADFLLGAEYQADEFDRIVERGALGSVEARLNGNMVLGDEGAE
uniref:Transmembrane domain-containing protein n=1 Tax=Spironucleus salmonicida TaxID=348837 RepID=V6LTY0_9EUKA|eukprot:EST47673.1 Transmembrane domain-containing protein [Spironucleus salmonicida]